MVFAAASTACRPINAKDLYPVVGAGVPAWKQVKTGNGWLWMGLKVELVENLWNVQKCPVFGEKTGDRFANDVWELAKSWLGKLAKGSPKIRPRCLITDYGSEDYRLP